MAGSRSVQVVQVVHVSAVVAAYNEAATIRDVVQALVDCALVDEVIVVDDGSTDGTPALVPAAATLLRNAERLGKGQSLERGVRHARGRVLCFADADLLGLRPEIVANLVAPVVHGQADMTVGLRWLLRFRIPILRGVFAKLGGERVLTRELWDSVPEGYRRGFRIEAALNVTARRAGLRVRPMILPRVKQVIKERKRGVAGGLTSRAGMIVEITAAYAQLAGARRTP
ncbi:glycosyltransferase involved in cell wall biosynthesis [Catenulispora sp. EB89]|uniref:glycosyltransferase family 2 protein n=1 Tax=Catenulispora sp. EB89 TaxID=3156257 RepID=UPI003516EC9D